MPVRTLLLGLLLLPAFVFSQQDTVPLKNTLTIAPLRLIDPSNPGVELAYERLHSATRGTQVVVAYITPAFSKIDDWAQFHGFRLGVNEKFYTAQLENHFYGGAGFVFNRIQYRRSGFYTTTDETAAKSDTIQLHRTTIAFNIFYGAQVPAGHFIYEFSSGIGLKYRIITQNKPGWPVNYARDMGAFPSLYTAGRTWTLNLPVTIRLGYRF